MRFTCPRCGKKYASADEPAPGRVYSLTCRCGTKITVKGPEARPPGAPELTPASAAGTGLDPFPTERRRTQGGAPVASVDTGPAPVAPRSGELTPSASWAARTDRVPLREATPAPSPAGQPPAPAVRAAPAAPARPAPAPQAAPAPAAQFDPFANFPSPAAPPKPAAPLDPFADMPDLQAEARGEARPLTSVPDLGAAPVEPPATPPGYDPFAAQHGLLLDEAEARAIAGQAPVLEPEVRPSASAPDESEVTFSREMPAPIKGRSRAVLPKVASRGRGRLILAAAALAVVGGGAAAAWFFLGRPRTSPPTQAVVRPPPAPVPAPPVTASPTPAPAPQAPAAAPAAAPAPPATAASAPAAAAPGAAAAAPPPAGEARPEPRREPPRKRTPRHERQVAAAEAAPRQEAERPEPPKTEEPRKPAAEAPARKAESPPAAPVRTELTSAEVGASIRASAKAFDACVAEAARNEPNLQVVGRRVGLYITVNPSGVVTGPHIDDAQVDESVLGACLKATARKMVFPAFQGEAFQVRIPMVLGGGK